MNECFFIRGDEIHSIGKEFFHQFRKELSSINKQLNDYFDLWLSYFKLSQTRYHRLFNDGIFNNEELLKIEMLKQDPYLIELRETVHRLENKHQNGIDDIFNRFIDLLIEGISPSRILPYRKDNKNDLFLLAISTMYYSTIRLIKSTIAIGTTIHNIFEDETTHRYTSY
ncbi:unnamed protein product [Adineta ricciae]|uniref:Uncharacterized protein n=1 Tax=Adineta ricciae TaxID=249248 RepID=A0A815FWT7_ADIRI|nr:unnamed protein product [Adineta ricciae]